MRYKLAIVLAAITMLATSPALPMDRGRYSEEVSVTIVSDGGKTLLSIPHRDFWQGGTRIIKKYFAATQGENYGMVIRNTTRERIGVVIAVDGRNIISGRRSELRSTEDIYIMNSREQGRFDGWRTGQDNIHKFYFTETTDSYAIRTFNDSSAMGVIAVAVYREKEQPMRLEEQRNNAPAAPSAESAMRGAARKSKDESAGTGFGEEQYSPTFRVVFEPEREPVQKTLIKYEWREVLCKKGILPCYQKQGNRLWDQDGYAPYPPGYPSN